MKSKSQKPLTHEQTKQKLKQFIQNYQDFTIEVGDGVYGRKKYLIKLQNIADGLDNKCDIEFEDAQIFFGKPNQKSILKGMLQNTERYIKLFTVVLQSIGIQRRLPVQPQRQMQQKYQNILRDQRRQKISVSDPVLHPNQRLPTSLHKKYSVSILYSNNQKLPLQSLSHLKAEQIGNLVVTKGIVTRIADVKPEIVVATYACNVCGCENYQQVMDITYTPLSVCQSSKCKENKVSGKLAFLASYSKFLPYQQVKIQQTPDQLNPGQVPTTKTLYLRGCNVNCCSPGDIVLIQGILLPTRKLGFAARFSLDFQTHIIGLKVVRQKKKYVQWSLTQQQIQKVRIVRQTYSEEQLFNKLAQAIAPEIYGLQYVKKALLLMMAGGVTKQTSTDNLKIRGQINIALIGDPGVAKSQLLKKIASIAPRAIYTTGKGSSGVGLTAAIVKDQTTKQIALEAGALVLADMGICCIDQFDKMDEYDRTAIHQAMEQQTISIAKAGITTTLNARTSILAAANPLFGRYNKSQSIHKNINLPAALLSRFDLVFILVDRADKAKDLALAYHISSMHMNEKAPQNMTTLDVNFLRTYVALSKQYSPVIKEQLHRMFISKYIQKRKMQADLSKEGDTYTTTRSLLALIRLSLARAKLRFSNQVTEEDINQSLELIQKSQEGVMYGKNQSIKRTKTDDLSQIYTLIKSMCLYSKNKKVSFQDVKNKVFMKGYTQNQLDIVIKNYEHLCVIQLNNDQIQLLQ